MSDEEISKVLIIKKGNLGLYYGRNNDREFFSSDVYGLVEECKYFYEFKNYNVHIHFIYVFFQHVFSNLIHC